MSLPALLRVLLAATCVFAAARAHANFRSLVQIASHAAHEATDARVVHVHDVAVEPNPAAAAADLQKDERSSSGSVPENTPRVPLPQRNEADSSDPAGDDVSEPYNVDVNIVYPRPGTRVLRQRDVFVHVDVSGNIHDAAHFLCLRVLSSLPTRQRDGVSGEATLTPEELRMREKNAFVQCMVVPGGQLAFRPSPSTPPELTLEVGLLSAVQPATSITDADLRLLERHVHAHGFVHARLVRSVRIAVVSPRTCAGRLGQAGCGRLLPHCHSAHTFRFFLEPLLFDGVHERLMHAALNGSTWRTDNADIACVFVVVTQMMTSNQHAAKSVHVRHRAIVTLPDWGNSGENHVLLHFGDYGFVFDVGMAMIAGSAFADAFLVEDVRLDRSMTLAPHPWRSGYDVVMPLSFYRCNMPVFEHLERMNVYYDTHKRVPASARTVVASFKGALYEAAQDKPAYWRQMLVTLHDGERFVMLGTCSDVSPTCTPMCYPPECVSPVVTQRVTLSHAQCAEWEARSAQYEYGDLLARSRFTIVAPGEGSHSYRLLEAMHAGSIPVVLGRVALPFPHVVPWDAVALHLPVVTPHALQALLHDLSSMPAHMVDAMQATGQSVYFGVFSSLALHVDALVHELRWNFYAAATRVSDVDPSRGDAALHESSPPQLNHDAQGTMLHNAASFQAYYAQQAVALPLLDAGMPAQGSLSAWYNAILQDGALLLQGRRWDGVTQRMVVDFDAVARTEPADVFWEWYEQRAAHMVQHIAAWLTSMHSQPGVRLGDASFLPEKINLYALLMLAYHALGIPRHAVTAAQLSVLYGTLSPDGPNAFIISPAVHAYRSSLRSSAHCLRVSSALSTLRRPDAGVGHTGALAHWLSPTNPAAVPLARSPHAWWHDAPAAVLPVRFNVLTQDTAGDTQRSKLAAASVVHVNTSVLQQIADVAASVLPTNWSSFMTQHASLVRAMHARLAQPSIAIVSLCAYNDSETHLQRLSTRNFEAYCRVHNYHCFMHTHVLDHTRPVAWSKILAVLRALPQHDWVMWRDCDTFFSNASVRVEHVLAAAHAARFLLANMTAAALNLSPAASTRMQEGSIPASATQRVSSSAWDGNVQLDEEDVVFHEAASASHASASASVGVAPVDMDARLTHDTLRDWVADAHLDLIASEDGFMLNTGMFLVRNSGWSLDFLQRVYGACEHGEHRCSGEAPEGRVSKAAAESAEARMLASTRVPFNGSRAWEQASVLLHMTGGVNGVRGQVTPESWQQQLVEMDATTTAVMRAAAHVQMLPQAWMNAYPLLIARVLRDMNNMPLHAVAQPGDWVIAFSGCHAMLTPPECEALYAQYAELDVRAARSGDGEQ